MAKNIKGITIELDGETKGLDKALQSVNKRSRDLNSELKEVERSLKFNPGNAELAAQKQRILSEQAENTAKKLKQLKDAQEQVDDQFAKGKINQSQYDAFQREIIETQSKLDNFEDKLKSTQNKVDTFGDRMKKAGDEMKSAGEKIKTAGEGMSQAGSSLTTGLTAPLLGLGALAGKVADEHSSAQGKIRAQLGLTADESKEFEKVSLNLWKNAFGESVGEAAEAVALVSKNMQYIPSGELEKAAEKAFILRDAFDVGVAESTRTADQLMAHFGLSASDAFDIITKGFQDGLDFSGEWLDTLNEYAPQFSALGMSAEDMFNQLAAGADAGAFNLDKVGDAAKEFNIRVKDGSKTTSDSMKQLSSDTRNLWKAFLEGDATGGQVMQSIITELSNMDDKVKANQIGVGLFGTQWEDLETDVISALGNGTDFLGEFKGATEEAGKALYDNFGTRLSEAWREMQVALIPLGESLLKIAEEWLPKVIENVKKLADWFVNLSPSAQQVVLIMGALVAALGPLLIILGSIISVVGSLIGIAGGLGISLGALLAPVGLVVAAIAALIAIGVLLYKNWDEITKFAKLSWSIISKTVKDKLREAEDTIRNVMNTAKNIFDTVLNWIDAKTDGKFSSITDSVRSYLDMALGIIESILGFWERTFENALKFIKALLEGDFEAMGEAVSDQMGNIRETISEIWSKVEDFFGNIDLKAIGEDIIQGLIDGVGAMKDKLLGKAEEIANKVKKVFTGLFDINSPSRWMRDEIGKNMMTGWIQGIESMEGKVQAMTNKMGNMMKPEIPSMSRMNPVTAGGYSQQPIILQAVLPDGKVLAEATYPDINRRLYADQQQANRTGGTWRR
jgi:phage-related minor tail protein